MATLLQDLRYGFRMLGKNAGFTAVAVLTLALGIGANTAIFSIVNSVMLTPLAYDRPEQLYIVREIVPQLVGFYPTLPANASRYQAWRRECRSFSDMAAMVPITFNLTGAGDAEQIHAVRSTQNLFPLLGVRPRLGRLFLPDEDQPGRDHVAILTDAFWRSRFNSDPSIVGKDITLNGNPFIVVGVLPPSFRFPKNDELGPLTQLPSRIDLFKPMAFSAEELESRMDDDFTVFARLKPGLSSEQGLAELNVVQTQISQARHFDPALQAAMWRLEDQVVGPARRGLLILMAAVGAVLLIVCVNLANFLLARSAARQREVAIRAALGATRPRLIRQVLTEAVLLGLMGGTLGIWLAYVGLDFLKTAAIELPRIDEVHLDGQVLVFILGLSLVTGLVFGIIPALRLTRVGLQESLQSSGRTATGGRRAARLRETLIGFEVGLGAMLLILAGLLTTSLFRLLNVGKGFSSDHVLAVDVTLPPNKYTSKEQRLQFYDQALGKLRDIPGVRSAGVVDVLPLRGESAVNDITVPGKEKMAGPHPLANYRWVSPAYFQTMGISLLQGRTFQESERGRKVAIIAERVAKRFWPDENPLGKQFYPGDDSKPLVEVIGVVADIRTVRLDQEPILMVYLPYWEPGFNGRILGASTFVLGTFGDPGSLAGSVRAAIHDVDSQVPLPRMRPMAQVVNDSVAARQFQMQVAVAFAACALFLACLGIYGVVSYSVTQRRNELGLRMALGCQPAGLRWMVMRQGMKPVFAGLMAGVAGALALGRVVSSLLFGVTASDPRIFLVTIIILGGVGGVACYLPALRASRTDPMVALRYD